MEGTKMIYDALDALKMPPKMAELTVKIAELDEAIMQRMERDRKEINRLIRALQVKDEKIALYEGALEIAVEELEEMHKHTEHHTKKQHFWDCPMYVIDEETALEKCEGDHGGCLKTHFIKRGQSRLDMQKACADEIEGRKRMDAEDQKQAMKEGLNECVHKYAPYRPEWCGYPSFQSFDYCWGLAVAVDDGTLQEFLKDKCKDCEYSKHYQGHNPTLESLDDIVRKAEGLGKEMEEKMRR